jgi:hypothetical protein
MICVRSWECVEGETPLDAGVILLRNPLATSSTPSLRQQPTVDYGAIPYVHYMGGLHFELRDLKPGCCTGWGCQHGRHVHTMGYVCIRLLICPA